MVDFRYHLISLIGVILALALGILAGSGFLGGPILEQLQDDVDNFRRQTRELQGVITEQDAKLSESEDFARASEPLIVRGQLAGEEIVLFQFEGTEGRLADEVRDALGEAGAQVVSQVTFTEKLGLTSAPARDELSLITGSLSGDPKVLLEDVAGLLGERAADAAEDPGDTNTPNTTSSQRFESLLEQLETAEFAGSDLPAEGPAIPSDALFVIVGGSNARPPFPVERFIPVLAAALTEKGSGTVVVESSTSTWSLVASVRGNIEARAGAATVDNADTVIGRIALVLGLDQVAAGNVGHFGTDQGRTAIIPGPNPSV